MVSSQRILALLLGATLSGRAALAGEYVAGDYLRVYYNDNGTWNDAVPGTDPTEYVGLQAIPDGETWVDFTGPGTPWQYITLSYTKGGTPYAWYGSYTEGLTTWTVLDVEDDSTSDNIVLRHQISAGSLLVTKTETWSVSGAVIAIDLSVTNIGSSALDDVRVQFAVDPDQDYDRSPRTDDGSTENDSVDLINEDGELDFVESVGPYSGYTMGLGVCDPSHQEIGHTARNTDLSDTESALSDIDGDSSDLVLNWRHDEGTVDVDGEFHARLLVVIGSTESVAQDLYTANVEGCATCDADEDGHEALACGGDDCDDEDPTAYPGTPETYGDGVDNDCDGIDDDDDNDDDGVLDELEDDYGMDYTTRDSDGDGYLDGQEIGDDPYDPRDSDGDGIIDPLDPDDDDDGVMTIDELRTDTDGDDLPNYLDDDDDGDGIPTLTEGQVDTDGDGTSDYLDRDSDDDGIVDATEGVVDTDGDGTSNYLDIDSDADGKDDAVELLKDRDCDGVENYVDADDYDGPCYEPPYQDWRGGGGATCASAGGRSDGAWLALGLAALLIRRRR